MRPADGIIEATTRRRFSASRRHRGAHPSRWRVQPRRCPVDVRVGRGDAGKNADRIHKYLQLLREPRS